MYSDLAESTHNVRNRVRDDHRAALESEKEMRRQVAQLQRQVTHARARMALEAVERRNHASAEEKKADIDRRSGREIAIALAQVQPADPDSVIDMSERLNQQMDYLFRDPQSRGWFRLFSHMDDDKSGRISYREFIGMVREELKLSPSHEPESELQAVWRSLDADASGYISAGEFGRFMRLGEAGNGVSWRDRLEARNRARAEEVKADLHKRVGRDISVMLSQVDPAGEDQVIDMSARLNQQMDHLFRDPQSREWFRLFAHMDDDKSGRIAYKEFVGMVREELKLTAAQMSEYALQQLWRALDADASGYISAGEFGRFMRLGQPEQGISWRERVEARNRAVAVAKKREMEQRSGRDIADMLAQVQPASAQDVQEMSDRLNNQMNILIKDPKGRQWFKLFAHMDDDRSGRLTFKEFIGMVREELKLPNSLVPDSKLQQIWRALDEDVSGWINTGEFGRFMRLGQSVVDTKLENQSTRWKKAQKAKQAKQEDNHARIEATRRASNEASRLQAEAERLARLLEQDPPKWRGGSRTMVAEPVRVSVEAPTHSGHDLSVALRGQVRIRAP